VRDTDLVVIDDYALIWSPRPNLDLSVQSYGGAATIPSVSGLSLANPYVDTGWKQAAVTVTYHLTALPDMLVKFAAGNGEGEETKNLDAQQYFGFQIGASVIKGLKLSFGASFDGNSAGSEQVAWDDARRARECGTAAASARPKLGYSTQRLAAGIAFDGAAAGLPGLDAAFGWQRSVLSDLDKEHTWAPTKAELAGCPTLDADTYFVEDPANKAVNTLQRAVYDVSLKYRPFDAYFAGIDLSTRRIDSGSVDAFTTAAGANRNTLSETSYVGGAGAILSEGLIFTLEYARYSYDRKYAQFVFPDRDGKTSTNEELFDARLAYDW
jgi:hypothetical protein